jgi:lipopolysaccharide transport protein LptA
MRGSTRSAIHRVSLLLGALVVAAAAVAAEPEASSEAAVSPHQGERPGGASQDAATPSGGKSGGTSLFPIQGDKPLSIRSDELEAVDESGHRRLVFTRNVHIEQDDLTVLSNRLEAFYPPGANEPERMVATGNVRVSQRDKRMACNTATYFRSEDRILCVGDAKLEQGNDVVQGKEIEIFVRDNRVKVRGGAVVNVTPSQSKPPAGTTPAQAAKASP